MSYKLSYKLSYNLSHTLSALFHRLAAARAADDRERGDVPGWVLITVMTAGLVTALWIVAEPQLKTFFESAVSAVHGP